MYIDIHVRRSMVKINKIMEEERKNTWRDK